MEEQTTQGIDLSVFLHNFRRTLQHFFWVPIVLGLLLGGVSWLRAARSYAPVYQSSAVFSVSAGFSSSTDILSHSTYLDSNAAAQLSATFPYWAANLILAGLDSPAEAEDATNETENDPA